MSSTPENNFETELNNAQQELESLGEQISELKQEVFKRGYEIDKLEKKINIKQIFIHVLICAGILGIFFPSPYTIALGILAIGSGVGLGVNISKQNKKFQADYNSLSRLEYSLKNLLQDYYNIEFKISALKDGIEKQHTKESSAHTHISQRETVLESTSQNNSDDALNC